MNDKSRKNDESRKRIQQRTRSGIQQRSRNFGESPPGEVFEREIEITDTIAPRPIQKKKPQKPQKPDE